jgi:cytochrome P450
LLTDRAQAQGRPYLLARGDTDLLVLPARLIPELNRLGTDVLNSRLSHAFTLVGDLTGMTVVRQTSYHVRMLLSRISPALSELFPPTAARIATAMEKNFTQTYDWTVTKPLPSSVRCFSEGIAIALFGADMAAENPNLVRLTYEHTENVFKVAFAMRCVPSVLQPVLVWLLPAKWRLTSGWQKLENLVVPEVARQKQVGNSRVNKANKSPNLLSWMVQDGKTPLERDPSTLTTLIGSVAAGSTYSIANFVCRALSDLAAHPDVLEAVRSEIYETHEKINGLWNLEALASLEKLESAMKETARLAPGTLIVYSRVVQRDHVLSDGTALKKGQFITISGPGRATDPATFDNPKDYNGLRFCAEDKIQEHRGRPFNSVDTDILTWGAGRWACPGRLIADMGAKILLLKMIGEYDFAFVNGKPLSPSAIHEFLFFHPDNQMLVRRRRDCITIKF